jgi:hypothetical protein
MPPVVVELLELHAGHATNGMPFLAVLPEMAHSNGAAASRHSAMKLNDSGR